MAFFGITVNFIIQKLKSKHLVCLSFLWWQVFLRERGKIFYTYSGPERSILDFDLLFKFGFRSNFHISCTQKNVSSKIHLYSYLTGDVTFHNVKHGNSVSPLEWISRQVKVKKKEEIICVKKKKKTKYQNSETVAKHPLQIYALT